MTGKIIKGIFIISVAIVVYSASAPPPVDMYAHTGAAGEATCVSCHSDYSENSGGGLLRITANPPFFNGHYVPGTTYEITEVFTQPPTTSYQCSTEIVDSAGNNMGNLIVTDSANSSIQTSTTGRNCLWANWYTTDTFYCRFGWTAPQSGTLGIYAAGVVHTGPLGGTGGYAYSDKIEHLTPGTSTGIDKIAGGAKTFTILDNPAHGQLLLSIAENINPSDIQEISIYSANGNRVIHQLHFSATINLNGLAPGTYTIAVKHNGEVVNERLVIF